MFGRKNTTVEKILILGLGGVGTYLAKRLVHEGYAITVIEADPALIRDADGSLDARLIQGNAMSIECWRRANAEKMDYLIAVTDNDAVNMMAALIAHRFGIPRKIARIRSLEFGGEGSLFEAHDLKIDLIIHPEELAAQEIVRIIKLRAGNDIIDIADGQIQVMATRIHESSPLAHKKLIHISETYHEFPFRVVALARGIQTIIPGGDQLLLPQDHIFLMAAARDLPKLMKLTGVRRQNSHRVMILGGGLVGSRVAQLLEKSMPVTVVEKDEKSAEALSFNLKNAEVLHGDGSDAGVLQGAGLQDVDTFITATGDNETNIMSCLLAKHLMNGKNGIEEGDPVRKSICLVNKEDYLVLAASIGSDIALNKKILAGNEILKFIRMGQLFSVAHLHGLDAEMVEIKAEPNARITRKPLSRLGPDYYGKMLIGAVFRDGEWRIAVGDTRINDNERAIVVAASLSLKQVQQLFFS